MSGNEGFTELEDILASPPSEEAWEKLQAYFANLEGDAIEAALIRAKPVVDNWPAHIASVASSAYSETGTSPSAAVPYWPLVRGLYIDWGEDAIDAITRFPDDHGAVSHVWLGDEAAYDEPGLDFVSAVPALRSIFIDGPSELSDLGALRHCPDLKTLILFGYSGLTDPDEGLAALAELPALRRLYFGEMFVDNADSWRIPHELAGRLSHLYIMGDWCLEQAWQGFSNLEELVIRDYNINEECDRTILDDTGLGAALGEAGKISTLKRLMFDCFDSEFDEQEQKRLTQLFQSLVPHSVEVRVLTPGRYGWNELTDRWLDGTE